MSYSSLLRDIKTLKIQGAYAIARAGLQALHIATLQSKTTNTDKLLDELQKVKKELINLRPTEPFLQNALSFVFLDVISTTVRELREEILHKIQSLQRSLEHDQELIISIGAQKIPKGSVVFTHCHSSTVASIILAAAKQGKNIEVHNTETRPLYQGRIMAEQLSKAGIAVTHYVDAAARAALKKADIFLLGADALSSEGSVINKIGSAMIAHVAQDLDIPVYVCTHGLKLDAKTLRGKPEPIEQISGAEIWEKHPKGVTIHNPAFEVIDGHLITGIISELGIFKPGVAIEEILKTYPWLVQPT